MLHVQYEIVGAYIPDILSLPTDIVGFTSKEAAETYIKNNKVVSHKGIRESTITIE